MSRNKYLMSKNKLNAKSKTSLMCGVGDCTFIRIKLSWPIIWKTNLSTNNKKNWLIFTKMLSFFCSSLRVRLQTSILYLFVLKVNKILNNKSKYCQLFQQSVTQIVCLSIDFLCLQVNNLLFICGPKSISISIYGNKTVHDRELSTFLFKTIFHFSYRTKTFKHLTLEMQWGMRHFSIKKYRKVKQKT